MATATAPGFVACCTMPDAAAIARAVGTLFGNVGYVVIATVNDMQFQWLRQVDLAVALPACEEGRVFSHAAELRWRRTAKGDFAALLLTEDEWCVPSTWERVGTGWSAYSAEEQMRLWGERQPDWAHWIEVRIPRALVYPVARTTGAVHVSWVEYRDNQGTPRLIRFKEVR